MNRTKSAGELTIDSAGELARVAAKLPTTIVERAASELAAESQIRLDRCAVTRRNTLILPTELPVDRWREIGQQILRISTSSGWWLGDWLLYGERAYPDRYRKAIEGTMLDYQTLRNYAWVARRFRPSRRRDGLSVQHHIEVAALSDEEQDVWLDRAERFSWSRNRLRALLKTDREVGARGIAADNGTDAAEQPLLAFRLNISPERKQLWADAAERSKLGLVEWMAAVLDRAAQLLPERDTNWASGGSRRLGNTANASGRLGGGESEPHPTSRAQARLKKCLVEGIEGESSGPGALPQAGVALMFPQTAGKPAPPSKPHAPEEFGDGRP